MYQKLVIAGYLGRDPEMRFTQDGTPVANFSVATTNTYNNRDGERVSETTWFRVSAWRRLAEVCNEYLRKGRPVLVEGTLVANEHGSPRTWQTSSGEPRASFEIRAQTVKFLGGGSSTESTDGPSDENPFDGEAGKDPIPF
jgi:single-strand DNA-binding protein